MLPFIANTDRRWFDFLSTRMINGRVDEVNFWQPSAKRPMKQMSPGEPIFFRLKSPTHAVAGFGFYAHFQVVNVDQAWDLFGWRNGDDTRSAFYQRIGAYRREDMSITANQRQPMGCTVLRDAHFWPDHRWLPWAAEQGWQPNIVQGKTENDSLRAAQLLGQITLAEAMQPADLVGAFSPLSVDRRVIVDRPTVQREGQGTFRLRLLDAYGGRCAITGERTQPVLDAAHIQPYLGPESNHVQNGLLLTKEFHALFDDGYVTVTPDNVVRVSSALRETWQNGVRYYAYDNQVLRSLPQKLAQRPSRDALAWHQSEVFLGT